MSKTNQRKISYFSAGRKVGFKYKELQAESTTNIDRKYFAAVVPKEYKNDFLFGWAAGLRGEVSNQCKKKSLKFMLDKRNK